MSIKGTLVFFCGKMGAGKTTKAQQVAIELEAILLSEDEWLAAIYPEEIHDLNDYIKYSARIKSLLKPHVQNILNSGISVVMDFPGNTQKQRTWFKEIISEHQFPHKLIYLEAEDQLCLKQLVLRRVSHPERAKFDTVENFHRITSYFQPPSSEEGFNMELVSRVNA
ncbi:MAG: ATP-binding protein [Thermosynechococcaceae cyanobacterium]